MNFYLFFYFVSAAGFVHYTFCVIVLNLNSYFFAGCVYQAVYIYMLCKYLQNTSRGYNIKCNQSDTAFIIHLTRNLWSSFKNLLFCFLRKNNDFRHF